MGSPVPGFLVLSLLGIAAAWKAWRNPVSPGRWIWQRQDTWLAASFMSIFLFKILSLAWSDQPNLALANAGWHLYFLLWPLVLLGVHQFKSPLTDIEKSIACGLIFVAIWRLTYALTEWALIHPGTAGVGLLAQLAMTMGAWNLLALTRPDYTEARWRGVMAVAFVSTLIILILSTRRQELFGFILISTAILAYRFRHNLTPWRAVLGTVVMLGLLGIMVAIRWEKFAVGFQEVQYYLQHGHSNIQNSSWGARMEMWRVGWLAFWDNPWLGMSASVRPSGLQVFGAPPLEVFGHRHFHQQFLQTLAEGGLLGLMVFLLSLGYSLYAMVLRPYKTMPEIALISMALFLSYFMEGLVSAALVYDKPNALLVVTSAWLWVQIRQYPTPMDRP